MRGMPAAKAKTRPLALPYALADAEGRAWSANTRARRDAQLPIRQILAERARATPCQAARVPAAILGAPSRERRMTRLIAVLNSSDPEQRACAPAAPRIPSPSAYADNRRTSSAVDRSRPQGRHHQRDRVVNCTASKTE